MCAHVEMNEGNCTRDHFEASQIIYRHLERSFFWLDAQFVHALECSKMTDKEVIFASGQTE